jgi:Protein of unknown function (DUF4054)
MPVVPCPSPCPAPTPGVVEFLASEFVAIYPEFAGLANSVMAQSFVDAAFLLNNSCGSIVFDANQRLQLLYTLTAHCLLIDRGTNDGAGNVTPAQGIVGRIDSAAEGSVSVSASYNNEVTQSEAYYIQTKYGAKFWEQTSAYRTAHYIGPPSSGPNGPGFPWGFGSVDEF